MDKIKTFNEKVCDFIKEQNNDYFKINVCIYSLDRESVRIYTLIYEQVNNETHIFNLKNQFVSYAVCKKTLDGAINKLCKFIQNEFGFTNPYEIIKIGNLFS